MLSQDVIDRGARMIKELLKHAQKDDCYACRKILGEMGIEWEKPYEELVKEAKQMYPES